MKRTCPYFTRLSLALILAGGSLFEGAASADVFDMPAGQTSLAFVPVGDPGNPGQLSGSGAGGIGPDAIVGGVGYSYLMGKFDVTAAQYTACLNAVAATDTYGLYDVQMVNSLGCNIVRNGAPGSYSYTVASDWANRPVNYVSWGNAARFSNWLSNGQPTGHQGLATTEDGSYFINGATTASQLLAVTRSPNARYVLPTESEWYKMAYYDPSKPGGPGYWQYPTRSDAAPSNVLSSAGTNNANFRASDSETIGPPYYRTEVGAFASSLGPYGTFDQGGNVWQWNESLVDEPSGPVRSPRGGSWVDTVDFFQANHRDGRIMTGIKDAADIGFRVAEVPEPTTMALLFLGYLAASRRTNRRIR